MAVDPYIARGVQPIDISQTLAQVAALKQRDQSLSQDQQTNTLYQRKYDDAQARQAKEDQEDELVGSLLREGRLDEAFAIDPDTTAAFAQFKGIDPQTLLAKERITQDQSQFDKRMQVDQSQFDANLGLRRQDMAADQSYRDQSLALQRQQEARLAAAAGTASTNNPMGLNERQQGGLAMRRDNAVMYAANLTGMSRKDIERILSTEGPEGVYKVMVEKGKRSIQGKTARWLQSIPLGKTFVEAENADLLAPGKAGGAGVALMQNPSGPITQADFQAGEAQFPNATYPLETQADMVRQMLTDPVGGGQSTQVSAPPADRLKEGVVTTFKNGQRWTLKGGKPVQVQ
jgi:hypothetical protein